MSFALLSVSDKTGIREFAQILVSQGINIISTGGTAKALTAAGIKVIPIQEITGNPESFGGRMKTISFAIASGILFDRRNPSHRREAKELQIRPIDIVVCNFYPFEQTIGKNRVTLEEAIESIDVGGPTMVRAAAKNHQSVLVVVDPGDYESVGEALTKNNISDKLRQDLAAKAFGHVSYYDAQIARYLSREQFSKEKVLPGKRSLQLRYGENPHQRGVVYLEPNTNSPLKDLTRLTGRELSYTNFTDIAAGLESVRIFREPAAAVIKHNSPSGIALGKTPTEALSRAVMADPVSAFGGTIVINRPLDFAAAQQFASFKEDSGVLIDVIAVPGVTAEAREIISQVRKSTGVYIFAKIPRKRSTPVHVRFFDGGFILQDWDEIDRRKFKNWQVMGRYHPTPKQRRQMEIAWKFISRVRSNSVIVVDRNLPLTRGIGSGQTSRVRSAEIALVQAGKHAQGAILASDSFFPFPDCVELAARYKIGAILQQGGSVNDAASIKRADGAHIPMVATRERKFWH